MPTFRKPKWRFVPLLSLILFFQCCCIVIPFSAELGPRFQNLRPAVQEVFLPLWDHHLGTIHLLQHAGFLLAR